jgi:SAM-dependent methyltransferase
MPKSPARTHPPASPPAVSYADVPVHPRTDLSCACCGAPNPQPRGSKHGNFVDADFQFYSCRKCGFLFDDPIVDFAIYDDRYYSGKGADPLVNYQAEYQDYLASPRRYEFNELLALALQHLQRNPRPSLPGPLTVEWLDFGCGAGGLLKFLRDTGSVEWGGRLARLELTGHDVGSYAHRLKYKDHFRILDFAEIHQHPPASFDVISCIDVIEHLPEPAPVVELLARLLKPGGLLLLITGNLAAPIARLQGIKFPYCVPEIHVSMFTPRALSILYQRYELQPVWLRFDGMIRARLVKNLPLLPKILRFRGLAKSQVVRRLMDFIYGVSAMPCAVKPRARE